MGVGLMQWVVGRWADRLVWDGVVGGGGCGDGEICDGVVSGVEVLDGWGEWWGGWRICGVGDEGVWRWKWFWDGVVEDWWVGGDAVGDWWCWWWVVGGCGIGGWVGGEVGGCEMRDVGNWVVGDCVVEDGGGGMGVCGWTG